VGNKPIPYDTNQKAARQTIQSLTNSKGAAALYYTRDAHQAVDLENEARQNGLKLYNTYNPKASENSLTQIHHFSHPIGADGGQETNAIRLDGDHGHPIQKDNPQLKTSFNSYINNSADFAKKDIADAQATRAEIANFEKNGPQGTRFEKAAQKNKYGNEENRAKALREADQKEAHAKAWLQGATDYVHNTPGLSVTDYPLLRPPKGS
jgi:hypothetical protein